MKKLNSFIQEGNSTIKPVAVFRSKTLGTIATDDLNLALAIMVVHRRDMRLVRIFDESDILNTPEAIHGYLSSQRNAYFHVYSLDEETMSVKDFSPRTSSVEISIALAKEFSAGKTLLGHNKVAGNKLTRLARRWNRYCEFSISLLLMPEHRENVKRVSYDAFSDMFEGTPFDIHVVESHISALKLLRDLQRPPMDMRAALTLLFDKLKELEISEKEDDEEVKGDN